MKRLLFTFLLLLTAIGMWADRIPVEQARAMAADFFRSNHRYVCALHQQADVFIPQTRQADESPAYYVFNNEGGDGFVVMAADDLAARPVLGYSFTGSFPQAHSLPPAVRGWLVTMQREINQLRQHPELAFPLHRRGLSRVTATRAGNAEVSLSTALWDQAAPYWNKLNFVSGAELLVGCTSTALAIMMKYHEWPVRGHGELPGYRTATMKRTVPAVTLGHDYQWKKMRTVYSDTEGYSADEADAVATLMRDVSTGLQADYGTFDEGGTGAYLSAACQFLTDHMDYDRSILYIERDMYSADAWSELMKQELRARRPVVYDGFGSDPNAMGGHAFVLDGFTVDDYFHINFGWSGFCNGYYVLSNIYPEEQGAGGTGYDFSHYQGALVNAQPDAGGESIALIRFFGEPYSYDNREYFGIRADTDTFAKGVPFSLWAGWFYNAGNNPFTGDLRLALFAGDGSVKTEFYVSSMAGSPLLPGRMTAFTPERITIRQDLEPGDYIAVQYRADASSAWTTVEGSDKTIWKLVVCKEQTLSLAAATKVSYLKSTASLTISTMEGTSIGVKAPDGADATDAVSVRTDGAFVIDTRQLVKGSSVITLTHGTQTKRLVFTK